ncbi:MAG: hypothetical protein ACTSRS_21185 [Candidatus Helarchaeota archaeon]
MSLTPSFIVIATPRKVIRIEEVYRKLQGLSIRDSQENFKKGVFLDTIIKKNYGIMFHVGFEYELKYPIIDGERRVKACQQIPVILFENYVMIRNCTKELKGQVINFLQKYLVKGVALEEMKFEAGMLKSILQNADEIFGISWNPKEQSLKTLDLVSCIGREVRDSYLFNYMEDEPLVSVKIKLEKVQEVPRIGFHKIGLIVVYNRNFNEENLMDALYYVARTILDLYGARIFQKTIDVYFRSNGNK